jgi:hypothetical protein
VARKSNNQGLKTKVYVVIQDIQVKGGFVHLTLYDLRSINKLIIDREFYQKNQAILLIHQAVIFHLTVLIDNSKVKNIKVEKAEI